MSDSQIISVVGLGFGDEGKGSLIDYLVRETGAHTVVRYNGGAQAAHNVVDRNGRHHTFAQFGSGTLVPGVRTHLSRYMMVEPFSLFKEEAHLRQIGVLDALERLSIDRGALITTPYHQAANRLREMARGNGRHGSCGRGIGETMSDYLTFGDGVLFAGDLTDKRVVARKLKFIRQEKLASLVGVMAALPGTEIVRKELRILTDPAIDEFCVDVYGTLARRVKIADADYFRRLLGSGGTLIFEGAQGALLDENYGFHPYTTWSTTTLKNADELLGEQGLTGEVMRVGALRAFSTRHGAGPFVTQDPQLAAAIPDIHNGMNEWQREFRLGHLDLVATRYALNIVGGVDYLAVTNLDRLMQLPSWHVCDAYTLANDHMERVTAHFEIGADGQLTGIKATREPDLVYQEELTQLLTQCQPRYRELPADRSGYLRLLENELHVPIAIVSYGPRATDKHSIAEHTATRLADLPLQLSSHKTIQLSTHCATQSPNSRSASA